MIIAVCDDEKIYRDKTVALIKATLGSCGKINISLFLSGESLLDACKDVKFDLIFLDIEMQGINGLETAREIRKTNSGVMIVFLTGYSEFAVDGYEVGAFRYILKNQPDFIYKKQMASIADEYNSRHRTFEIMAKSYTTVVKLADIIYFEVLNKTVIVHTIDGNYEYFGKLSDIEKSLTAVGL